jgi:hypothetical protein
MNAVYPNEGLLLIQDQMLLDDMIVHLYVNDITPVFGTVLANLTEATWTGYNPVTINFASWVVKVLSSNRASALGNVVTFTNGSGSTVQAYGYFLTNAAGTKLRQAVRFDSAPISRAAGETYLVFPTWGDFSEFG